MGIRTAIRKWLGLQDINDILKDAKTKTKRFETCADNLLKRIEEKMIIRINKLEKTLCEDIECIKVEHAEKDRDIRCLYRKIENIRKEIDKKIKWKKPKKGTINAKNTNKNG